MPAVNVSPPMSGAEDSPPQRALDAATARRDFVEQRDVYSFAVCRKGMLEWYCNDEWIGALSRLDFNPVTGRCRGVLRNSASTRGTWEPGVLPRGSGGDVQRLFANLADRAEVMHNIPVQGQWAEPRETELPNIPALELSSPSQVSERPSEGRHSAESRSTFSRRCLGIMSRIRSSPVSNFNTPPTTPSPRASDLAASIRAPPHYILNLAKVNGAYMEVEMRSTWMLCKRGRIERLVDGTWREAVTKILPIPSAESKKLTLQNTHGETKTLLVPAEGSFLSRLANLADRGGLVHELIPIDNSELVQDAVQAVPNESIPRNPVDDTYRMRRLLGNSASFWPLSADAPQPLPEKEQEQRSSPGGTGTTQSTEEVTLPGTPELPERPENMCLVCLEAPKNTVLFPCRHLCSCARCSVRLERCPLCRKEIEHRVEVWVSA